MFMAVLAEGGARTQDGARKCRCHGRQSWEASQMQGINVYLQLFKAEYVEDAEKYYGLGAFPCH